MALQSMSSRPVAAQTSVGSPSSSNAFTSSTPKRALGQSFVIDPNTIEKIVGLARVEPVDSVLEIGAGVGSLTLGLTAAARRLVRGLGERRKTER